MVIMQGLVPCGHRLILSDMGVLWDGLWSAEPHSPGSVSLALRCQNFLIS
jgi:hypothetical protein